MMSTFFMMIFMIPLVLLGEFWVISFVMLITSFLFLGLFCFDYQILYLSYGLGLDQLSFLLVFLSFWICSLMILASQKIYFMKLFNEFFQFSVLLLLFSLVISFCSLSFFLFYIFFEVSLIPTLFLILGWGYQPERLQAGLYLFFYTMSASLPMLVVIFFYYNSYFTLSFLYFSENLNDFLLFLCFSLVFFVKMPLFLLHLWLPKAHVEAPVSGSMILAGVMLKLGGYGLMRVLPLFVELGLKIYIKNEMAKTKII